MPSVASGTLMDTVAGLGETLEKLGDGGLGKMLLGNRGLEQVGEVLNQVAQDGGLGKWILGKKAQENLEPTIEEVRLPMEPSSKRSRG